MGLKKLSEKVADYNERLERGEAVRIKPNHVRKVLKKLRKKKDELDQEVLTTKNLDKKVRLERKLEIANQQITRAEWLLNEIT